MMKYNLRNLSSAGGWLVFLISFIVYFFSAERTGSLWDCGEFILGAYKLQVVHPPGAPLFLLIGRLFAWVADIASTDPAKIAFAVNLMSGISSAGAALLVAWTTMIFSKLALTGRGVEEPAGNQKLLIVASGIVAGLATAFSSSIWFSAVEGEVYALSTFFTALTLWATAKWYSLPDEPQTDRWLIFAFYSAGLSIGVHLLSILTFPAIGLFYYFKKYKQHTLLGMLAAAGAGVVLLGIIQVFIITGIPKLWAGLELLTVNGLGLPFHSGLIPLFLIIGGLVYAGFRYAHRRQNPTVQNLMVALSLIMISYSVIGIVVIRANAGPPINMNAPTDAHRLLPYLNREQYGERPLLKGPYFDAQAVSTTVKDKYGRVGDRYEIVDYKVTPEYRASDEMLFPRMGHNDEQRQQLYRLWIGKSSGKPTMGDNIEFFWKYQIKWMYWRYFMWNFAGRQNGEQGFFSWDLKRGNWANGLPGVDDILLYNQSKLPATMKNDEARNSYFLLPFIFGLMGLYFQWKTRQKDTIGLLALFLITGIGIIIYSNQPPNEPRERDYVLVGSFFTFCIWIGMGVIALHQLLMRIPMGNARTAVAFAGVLAAPVVMGFQNFDDHSRRHLTGARDYASNFLESCDPNAIIFTYGDNDTYPLWYAQEVEGIRTDVRVINLSLIAVDWYINSTRRKVNNSPAVKFSLTEEAYRGSNRNILYFPPNGDTRPRSMAAALQFMGEYHPLASSGGREFQSYLPSKNLLIEIDKSRAIQSGWVSADEADRIESQIPVNIASGNLTKDELAVLDILYNNMYDRPIYFSVTTRDSKLMGMGDYMRLEGLGLRFVPIKTPGQKGQFGIHGNGDIDADKIYERVMTKFRWGGFDKHDQFVTSSFLPSYYAHKTLIERAAYTFLARGENQKAIDLADKYFEAFPHMNFPYDARILNLLRIYEQAGAYGQAKKHIEILANETEEYLEFYQSLSREDFNKGFAEDQRTALQVVNELERLATSNGDNEYLNELKTRFDVYKVSGVTG
jgi:tetratricopeptide (TPR) repeat protein